MMQKQHISSALGWVQTKSKPIFSETEIKAFKTLGGLLLAIIAGAGVLALAATAPNVIGAIGKLSTTRLKGKNYSKSEKSKKAARAIYYLKRSGLIKIKRTAKEILLSLTGKGKQKLEKINFETLRVKPQKRWDGKWWLIAADIPTKAHKISADLFRKKLKEMAFYSLQRTLWLFPFDPRPEVQFIAAHYGIDKFVTVMEVNRLDKSDEKILKTHFNF